MSTVVDGKTVAIAHAVTTNASAHTRIAIALMLRLLRHRSGHFLDLREEGQAHSAGVLRAPAAHVGGCEQTANGICTVHAIYATRTAVCQAEAGAGAVRGAIGM